MNQLPWLPEALLRAWDHALLRRVYARSMPPEDVDRYIVASAQPGALSAALNYYRAAARSFVRGGGVTLPRIDVPVLVVWGARDRAVSERVLDGLDEHVSELTIVRIERAGHFVHWHSPAAVNAELLAFLAQG